MEQKLDSYQEITDKIILSLESGCIPWVKPWSICGMPANLITSRPYSGINTILLSMTPYASSNWLTFKQALDVGANVRKGEHGTKVILYKPINIKDAKNEGKEKSIPFLKTFTVFNSAQIDNLPEKFSPQAHVTAINDDSHSNPLADELLTKATIEHGHNKACFVPSLDKIMLPNRSDFKTDSNYYGVALHELTHWTGHKSRLARDFSGRFGDQAYAFEELIAELGAAFTCALCKVDGKLQHDSYIASWLKILKDDKRAIFAAASQARQATEYLVNKPELIEA